MAGAVDPRLSPDRLRALGLSRDPFAPPEEAAALFRNTALDMLCRALWSRIEAGTRLQLVKGEPGSGKTAFALRLAQEAPAGVRLTALRARRNTGIGVLLARLAGFSAATEVHTLAVQAAAAVFRTLRQGRQPVLLIDDADRLADPVLRMLLRFQRAVAAQGRGELCTVLLGEKALEARLAAFDPALLPAETFYSHQLRPLSRQDALDYLAFRYRSAGGDRLPLSARRLARLAERAGGLPGRLDALAREALARRRWWG
ncbi:MAG: hypothetical protein KatS3mg121_1222 [Gammaproteobacteria bacterium]|nr:MAG: hypothetical protein KatS3mg121_1222 [Gammaproteobacteria bacterium]